MAEEERNFEKLKRNQLISVNEFRLIESVSGSKESLLIRFSSTHTLTFLFNPNS